MSVFFSGTGHEASQSNTLVYLLQQHIDTITDTNQKIMAFDGCGVSHGTLGMIFGTGLDEQCQDVIEQVEAEIKKAILFHLTSMDIVGELLVD